MQKWLGVSFSVEFVDRFKWNNCLMVSTICSLGNENNLDDALEKI